MSDLFCTIDTNRKNGLLFNVPPTRYTPENPYLQNPSLTQYELDMRRKVEILKYKKNTNGGMTKRQTFTQAIKGATQRRNYSQTQVADFASGNNVVTPCPPTISTAAGVPGPAFYLSLDTTVPLYNYTVNRTYATENQVDTETKWIYTTEYDIFGNKPKIATLNIKQPIDQSLYSYTFTTSVGLQINGNVNAPRSDVGEFSTKLISDLGVPSIVISVIYGGSPINLIANPVITFDSQFRTEVSGNVIATSSYPNLFNGNIYLGNMTVSNLLLPTSPGFTYDICINYIPSNTFKFIDRYSSTLMTNVKTLLTNSNKKNESGMRFITPVSSAPILPFSLSGE